MSETLRAFRHYSGTNSSTRAPSFVYGAAGMLWLLPPSFVVRLARVGLSLGQACPTADRSLTVPAVATGEGERDCGGHDQPSRHPILQGLLTTQAAANAGVLGSACVHCPG